VKNKSEKDVERSGYIRKSRGLCLRVSIEKSFFQEQFTPGNKHLVTCHIRLNNLLIQKTIRLVSVLIDTNRAFVGNAHLKSPTSFVISLLLSRAEVTYKTGFGLDDWIYCTLYIHTTHNYRQYSVIAILHSSQFTVTHALVFSAFTSRTLATDLQSLHCNFKSTWSLPFTASFPFYPYSATANSNQLKAHIPAGWSPETRLFTLGYCSILLYAAEYFFIIILHGPHRKQNLYCVYWSVTCHKRSSVARVRFAGMCLPSRCLAMGIHVTVYILNTTGIKLQSPFYYLLIWMIFAYFLGMNACIYCIPDIEIIILNFSKISLS
jgi:hypothetical protein